MKKSAYIRVSSEKQSYARQFHELNDYFVRMGIDPANIEFVTEKITTYTTFEQRAIYPILKNASEGDIVYVCQLDRLGRTVEDIIHLVKYADSKGLTLFTINDGQCVSYKTPTGKIILNVLATVAEMERELRAERCRAGIDAAKEEIKKNGYRIARLSGRIMTRFGNQKGCDMTAARESSALVRATQALEWKEGSVAYRWVIDQIAQGKSRGEVITEFNRLHELQPKVFCTRSGRPLSKGTLSHWLRETNVIGLQSK